MSLHPYVVHHRMVFVFVLLLLCVTSTRSCNHKERQALLGFKANLHNWDTENKDCCQWWGVSCNDGHVTHLQFDGILSGNSSSLSSLSVFSQLLVLDLSGIDFQLNHIPSSLSSLTNLRNLTISYANLGGSIRYQFANLSNLIHLDLSNNQLEGVIPISFGNSPSLVQLNHLDLSNNSLSGPIPVSLGYLTSLASLYLSENRFEGAIPESIGKLSSLANLDLSNNYLNGSVPELSECPSLYMLDLSRNELSGYLPISVGKLSNLTYLDVSSNSFEGLISDDHLLNLTKLIYLDISFNSFKLKLTSHERFSSKLKTIKMQSCRLGPSFPMWIQTQKDFEHLDISNAGISDHLPRWFWDLPPRLKFLNLSSNEIKGMLPNMTSVILEDKQKPVKKIRYISYQSFIPVRNNLYIGIDLSNNQLEGMIPVLPRKLSALNLSGNKFSGTLSFLCQIDDLLSFLDLSNNFLTGGLPDCLLKFKERLVVLNLSNNNLSGEIPSSFGFLSKLQSLYLRRNSFVGEIPMSLSNCTKLRFVDLGENKLSGNIPSWIGERLSKLNVLVLQKNRLNGSLPSQICLLNNLQFLDISANGLSGNIPRCFCNFTAMATTSTQDRIIMSHSYSTYVKKEYISRWHDFCYRYPDMKECGFRHVYEYLSGEEALFIDNALVAWKGTRREFGRGLYLLKSIDISSNKLYGKLPDEITNLLDLVSLNVSNNKLHGQVPKHMGRLRFLESLDLSRNEFSGNIPWSLSLITPLSYLDLSYNNLSGKIPIGTQLQRFNYTSYSGNPRLCGPPVTQRCGLLPPPATVVEKEDDEEDIDEFLKSYYMGMIAGFVVGFSGICGTLFLNRTCRYIFFGSLITMKDWIYVTTVVHFRNLHMKFKRS